MRCVTEGGSFVTSGSDGFVFRVAQRFQIALDALWLARLANPAPVPDDLVGKEDPFFLGNYLHQILLDSL